MKKICVVTGSRSEYGLLRWVIEEIDKDSKLTLQIIATGAHLSDNYGLTYKYIEEDGFRIDAKVDMHLSFSGDVSIVKSMGYCSEGMAEAFAALRPDILVVLGDRYELIPIASAALMMRIPIAHISGGDVTEGALDNEIRNAVSMMSTLHFPGTAESADNLRRMMGRSDHIWKVGEPGLDSFLRYKLLSREELVDSLGLKMNEKWYLVTLHPETRLDIQDNIEMANNLVSVLKETEGQFVISGANADLGGVEINSVWNRLESEDPEKFHFFQSLGQRRYLSLMRQVEGVLGNSSSGIVEAPFLGIPVLNIGNRQTGRHICRNVICSNADTTLLTKAIELLPSKKGLVDKYYGNGHTASLIVEKIKTYINEQ